VKRVVPVWCLTLALAACQHAIQSSPNVAATTSPTPLPTVSLLETFASSLVTVAPSPAEPSVSPIPPSHTDQVIINEVMEMLPPRLHSQVHWIHVLPGKQLGYSRLPNHGLVVTLGTQYVLYFDGALQPHSNVIYDPNLDSYLTVVTHDWQWYDCPYSNGEPTNCARPVH